MRVIAFFNPTVGAGQTSLVYHLAWMFTEMGRSVVAADLDPQSRLTSLFFSHRGLEEWWAGRYPPDQRERIGDRIGLLPGSLDLASKDSFSMPDGMNADLVLLDLGPNVSAFNHSALAAAQQIVIPLCSDVFSVEGLGIAGPWLGSDLAARVAGYVLTHHSRGDTHLHTILKWSGAIAPRYRHFFGSEPHQLATMRWYPSLMQMALQARKPMFLLKPADGAVGAHTEAVRDCYREYRELAEAILRSTTPAPPG